MSVVQVAPQQIVSNASSSAPKQFIDTGRVKIGGACRLVKPVVPAQFADKGRSRSAAAAGFPIGKTEAARSSISKALGAKRT